MRAKEVNPIRAFSLLEDMDGLELDQTGLRDIACTVSSFSFDKISSVLFQSLIEMMYNVSEMLTYNGYHDTDATRAQHTLLKSPNSFNTLKYISFILLM